MKKTCAIFTNIAPLYSLSLWHKLANSGDVDYFFYSSKKGFSGIRSIELSESKFVSQNGKLNWFFVKNLYLKDILIYQIGVISKCLITNYDSYIFCGEMYIFSNWIAALICKIRRKHLLFWGHGIYGNENNLKRILRLLYYKIADYHLVYGNRAKRLLVESGFSADRIYVVYNSLNNNLHNELFNSRNNNDFEKLKIELFPASSELPVIVFIGRLTREKKLSYLLKALSLSKSRGVKYNCLIIGEGGELNYLQTLSDSLEISDHICFYGASYDEKINANFIMLSECCVSPGNVGLTAIHSLSLGTPVITHNNLFHQMPEVEAVIEKKTGLFFKEDDINSLSEVIDDMILNKRKSFMQAYCIEEIAKFWNPASQTAVFDAAVLKMRIK